MQKLIYKIFIVIFIILSIPFILVIFLMTFVSSGWPVFFIQKRVGKAGKIFKMYKFRTMKVGSEKLQDKYKNLDEADGPVFKIRNDPRFTRIGKFLSHTGLDELPQLFNVLKGEMALIGPRPLPINEAKKLNPWQKERENILPGIISPWILNGHHRETFDNWMKSDIEYAKKKSLIYDINLFLRSALFLAKLFIKESILIKKPS